jgi:hypothetical protein
MPFELNNYVLLQVFGRILISELFKPDSEKTLAIKRVGGTAGGQKYVVSGILFKLVVDPQVGPPTKPSFIYGGQTPSYEYAMKAAGLELLGAITTFRFHDIGLYVPLQALVDHHGFRMIAMPWLPLHASSILYGSSDGGDSVHTTDPCLNELMRTVGTQLHWAQHIVLDKIGDTL